MVMEIALMSSYTSKCTTLCCSSTKGKKLSQGVEYLKMVFSIFWPPNIPETLANYCKVSAEKILQLSYKISSPTIATFSDQVISATFWCQLFLNHFHLACYEGFPFIRKPTANWKPGVQSATCATFFRRQRRLRSLAKQLPSCYGLCPFKLCFMHKWAACCKYYLSITSWFE